MAVTLAQVATAVGRPLKSTEEAQATLWIGDARTIISRGPDGKSVIDLDTLDQAVLDMVVREAVADRIKNPDPVSKVTVAVDDGSTSREYVAASGQLRIREEWWAMLIPAETGDAFSVPLAYTPDPRVQHHHLHGHHPHRLYPSLSDPSSYAG